MAVEMLIRIERVLGTQLSPSILQDNPTMEKLATAIDAGTAAVDANRTVLLKGSGPKTPVFWIPGGGGLSVMAFCRISSLIGDERCVYGLEASIQQSRGPIDLRVKARSYVESIRLRQPAGPYYILGFSAGSWLAYNMALQFESMGEQALLVVFDMTVPGYPTGFYKLGTAMAILKSNYKKMRRLPVSRWRSFTEHTIKEELWRLQKNRKMRRWNGEENGMDLFSIAEYHNWRATDTYRRSKLPRFSGAIQLVLATESIFDGLSERLDPRVGWRTLAEGGLQIFRVPGNHLSMLQEPHVRELAATLKVILDKADSALSTQECAASPWMLRTPAQS